MEPRLPFLLPATFRELLEGLASEHVEVLGVNSRLHAEVESLRQGRNSDSCTTSRSLGHQYQRFDRAGSEREDAGPNSPKTLTMQPAFSVVPQPMPTQTHHHPPLPGCPLVPVNSEHEAPTFLATPPSMPHTPMTPPALLPFPDESPKRNSKELWAWVRNRVSAKEVTEQAPQAFVISESNNRQRKRASMRQSRTSRRSEGARSHVSRCSRSSYGSVQLNPLWHGSSPTPRHNTCTSTEATRLPSTASASARLRRSTQKVWGKPEGSWLQRFILKPDDRKHLVWDILSLLVLSYDVLTTPLDVFDLPETSFGAVMAMTTLVFWTTDIFISFLSGFHTVSEVEMRPKKIALRYLKTWFVIDFTTVALEWLSVGGTSFLRFGKFVRGMRVIRMLRIVKVGVLFNGVDVFIRNETTMMVVKISRLVVFIVLINHFVACGWWAVGTMAKGVDAHWTDNMPKDNMGYAYFTSLHWALTQFTPASMEVSPTNAQERAFTISVMVLGLLVFSSFLSSISTLMTQLRQIQAIRHQEDLLIRRYIMEHSVSLTLGNRVLYFYRQNRLFVKKKRLMEQDVKAFEVLPDNLKTELHWEVFGPTVTLHPLFSNLNSENHTGLMEVCHRCMTERMLGFGLELFHYGKAAECMYLAVRGELSFLPGYVYCDAAKLEVHPDHWISEMVLWLKWVHQGTVCAETNNTEVMEFNANKFHEHVRHHPTCFEICRQYASLYIQRIADFCDEEDQLPQDVWGCDGSQSGPALQQLANEATERLKQRRDLGGRVSLWGIFFDPSKEGASSRNISRTLSRLASKLHIRE